MISVIIPCYNGETVIDRSIESVYVQDYESVELIVVDDGSTDQSKEHIFQWIDRFDAKGFILKYVYQKNKGLGAAINTGLKYVSGKYLTLLDADDYFLQGSIKKRADFLDEHPDYAGVRANGWELRGEKRTLFPEKSENKQTTDYFHVLLFNAAINWAGSYMVRTDVLFECYPDRNIYESRFGQNMQILLPTSYKRKFGYIDEPLMVYVIQQESHSHSADKQAQLEKADKNFYGYLDIYLHVINHAVPDQDERSKYINLITSWKFRHECEKALLDKDNARLASNLKELESRVDLTLNEKIKYYGKIHPVKSLFFRFIRRLSSSFH